MLSSISSITMLATIFGIILVSPSVIQLSVCYAEQVQHQQQQQALRATQMPSSTNKPATVSSSNSSPLLVTAGSSSMSQNATTTPATTTRLIQVTLATTPTMTAPATNSNLANISTKMDRSNQSQASSESNTSKNNFLVQIANSVPKVASASFPQSQYPMSMSKLVAALPYGSSLRNVASSLMVANPMASSASASQPMLAKMQADVATHTANKHRFHDIDNINHDHNPDKSHVANSNGVNSASSESNNKVTNITATLNLNHHEHSTNSPLTPSSSLSASGGLSAKFPLPEHFNRALEAKLDESDDGDYVDEDTDTDQNRPAQTGSLNQRNAQMAAIIKSQSRVNPKSSLIISRDDDSGNDNHEASDYYTASDDSSRLVKKERSLSPELSAARVGADTTHNAGYNYHPAASPTSRNHNLELQHQANGDDDDVDDDGGNDVGGAGDAAALASHNGRNNYDQQNSNKHHSVEHHEDNLVASRHDHSIGQHHPHHYGKFFQYSSVPLPDEWEFGYRRGNSKHLIERRDHGKGSNSHTKVKWLDNYGSGYGNHVWDYNHGDHISA